MSANESCPSFSDLRARWLSEFEELDRLQRQSGLSVRRFSAMSASDGLAIRSGRGAFLRHRSLRLDFAASAVGRWFRKWFR